MPATKWKKLTELEFIQESMEWPNWPALPVIRREESQPGIVLADEPTVYIGANIFHIHGRAGRTWGEKLKGFEQQKFASFEELLKVWRVD